MLSVVFMKLSKSILKTYILFEGISPTVLFAATSGECIFYTGGRIKATGNLLETRRNESIKQEQTTLTKNLNDQSTILLHLMAQSKRVFYLHIQRHL